MNHSGFGSPLFFANGRLAVMMTLPLTIPFTQFRLLTHFDARRFVTVWFVNESNSLPSKFRRGDALAPVGFV